ncbi:adenine phosphoribosyltransferase, partial [Nocardia sp. NPDC004722]
DLVAGVDARGFLLGAGVAAILGTGVIAVRKGGKLPPPVISREYTLEYGSAALEIPADGIDLKGRKVLLLDDVLATGGTLAAAAELFTAAGAEVAAAAVVLELEFLKGRERQGDYPVTSIVKL